MKWDDKSIYGGYVWHTTGSGKTLTSYKATRNLLMDIPSIQKTVFLIDRKDLDLQTKGAFQSYADNDTIDVDDTEHVGSLIKKLADDNRQMIVTTRQKMQVMINRRLKEGTKEYNKIRALKVAFVVDECHRAVTPQTKRDIERFFNNSIWSSFFDITNIELPLLPNILGYSKASGIIPTIISSFLLFVKFSLIIFHL